MVLNYGGKKPLSSIHVPFHFHVSLISFFFLLLSLTFPWLGTKLKSHLFIHPSLLFPIHVPHICIASSDGWKPTYLFIFMSIHLLIPLFFHRSQISEKMILRGLFRGLNMSNLEIFCKVVQCFWIVFYSSYPVPLFLFFALVQESLLSYPIAYTWYPVYYSAAN